MVEPVNNRGYYEYGRVNTKIGTGLESGEKFALNYDHMEKDSDQKEDEKTQVEADGVVAEFSSQSQNQYGGIGNERKNTAQVKESPDLGQTVERARGFIGELVKAVTDFMNGMKKTILDFWNSDNRAQDGRGTMADGEAGTGQAIDVTETSQELEGKSGIDTVEAEGIVEKSGDTRPAQEDGRRMEAERYLENTEQMNRYVKNSDLLTYYDRSGRIVQMNGADKNRILHGDRGTSKRI